MHIKSSAIIITILVLLSGCATSTVSYAPPSENNIQNSKQVNKPFDALWDQLIKKLSSDFFVINNIDKNSRLINLSFTSQRPSDFVDCGVISRTFDNLNGKQNYVYNGADTVNFALAVPPGAVHVNRTGKLEGRINIYVAPEGDGTLITVNAKYIVSINAISTPFEGGASRHDSLTFDFSTKQGVVDKTNNMSCYARGLIEQKILGFVAE